MALAPPPSVLVTRMSQGGYEVSLPRPRSVVLFGSEGARPTAGWTNDRDCGREVAEGCVSRETPLTLGSSASPPRSVVSPQRGMGHLTRVSPGVTVRILQCRLRMRWVGRGHCTATVRAGSIRAAQQVVGTGPIRGVNHLRPISCHPRHPHAPRHPHPRMAGANRSGPSMNRPGSVKTTTTTVYDAVDSERPSAP